MTTPIRRCWRGKHPRAIDEATGGKGRLWRPRAERWTEEPGDAARPPMRGVALMAVDVLGRPSTVLMPRRRLDVPPHCCWGWIVNAARLVGRRDRVTRVAAAAIAANLDEADP